MANIYASLHYHVVFSTKNREPWIFLDIERRIWRFMGGIALISYYRLLTTDH